MRSFLKFNIVLCLLILGLNNSVFAQRSFLVTPDSVGNLKIGMTVAEARKVFPRHTFSRASDGEGIALIEVKRRNRTDFFLYADEFDPAQPINDKAQISFIEIVNSLYRTEKGVYPNMPLSEVEKRYGKLRSIVTSEIEAREFARFTDQPFGIDLKVTRRNGQAGIYANGERRTNSYANGAYVASLILLGRSSTGGNDGEDIPVEMGFTSKYTNLKTQCETPKGQGEEGGHVSTYCEGYGGYRVHIFDTAKSLEITIQSENADESVSIASQSLTFDNNKQIEWRFKDGKPFAVIMRVDQYRMGNDGLIRYPVRKTGEFLIVKGLPGFEKIDYKINTRTTTNENEKAREMADAGYSAAPENNSRSYENLDIASYNRTIINASRRNETWVRSPMEVAVRLAGDFTEMKNRTMEFKYPSAEETNAMTLTVTNEGLLDDSVRAERYVFDLKKDSRGVWTVTSAQKSWSCWQNRGHQDFSAVPCI